MTSSPKAREPREPRESQNSREHGQRRGTPHRTAALLRAHLAAATRYRHLTRHCPICHRLLRLALESPPTADEKPVLK